MTMSRSSCGWTALGAVLLALSACQSAPSLDGDGPIATCAEAITIQVPGDYATIQAAVNAAAAGDTVQIAAGQYHENAVTVHAAITIQGAGPGQTLLYGQIMSQGVPAGNPGVVIRHMTIDGTGVNPALQGAVLFMDGQGTVTDMVIQNHPHSGIRFGAGTYGAARRNLVRRNSIGIVADEGNQPVTLTDNVVSFNTKAGIIDHMRVGTRILHNTVVGNAFSVPAQSGGEGILAAPESTAEIRNNIVVSNNGGIMVDTHGAPVQSNNLVWGNAEDYLVCDGDNGGDPSTAAPGDVGLDPSFVAAANGDYHLKNGSPAIDRGVPSSSSPTDFDGIARPQGAGPDLGAFEHQVPASNIKLVISEVMSNPTDEDRGEFVELYNAGPVATDLAGLQLSDGDARDTLVAFANGTTVVAPGAYAVIVDPEYLGGYDIPGGTTVVTVGNTTIGNGLSTSDPVTLYGTDGITILATYAHPFDPGNGVSAERVDLGGADSQNNWRASPCMQSAGRPNCAPQTLASGIIISEVMANPTNETTGEFIEIYNGTASPIDVGGMTISDGDSSDEVIGWGGGTTVVPGMTYAVILDPDFPPAQIPVLIDPSAILLTVPGSTLGNGLAMDDPITVLDSSNAVVDTYTRTLVVSDGHSVEKVSLSMGDVEGNWAQSSCPTGSSPGSLNCVSSASAGPHKPLVISEVMSNPLDEDTGEFIELYNRGIDPVDAAGLILGDGDAVDVVVGYQGGSTVIPAGGYALILDAEYAGPYGIPPGTILLSTPDTTLGSGLALDDQIRLYESNGVEVIDSYRHPFNPGNGRSAERIDLRAFDTAANWTASTCASGSSPGANNCAAAPAGLPKQLRITEVLANQAGTEGAGEGELVEVINFGDRAVDLAGMFVEAGPDLGSLSRDGLLAWAGGATVLVPGAFAVVIDPQYDGRYAFPSGTVVMTIDDSSFGSSSLATTHLVQLIDADGITILDRFGYPSDPGDGVSLHRISLTAADSASNWTATPCGSTPGAIDCPTTNDVTTYVSFWADRYGDESGIYWYQTIGWPNWHDPICELLIVCDGASNHFHYRDNFPATSAFSFQNPYPDYSVMFVERSSPTDDCGGMPGNCTNATFVVAPGIQATVPASSLGYYFARTDGPSLNSLDWFGGDPDLYWTIPPDGILAPFHVEVHP
jgi:hypothetical protein